MLRRNSENSAAPVENGEPTANQEERCPIGGALLELLQASVDDKTTKTADLAELLNRSPATIRTEFQRIFARIGVKSRLEAVLTALDRGWISRRPNAPEHMAR